MLFGMKPTAATLFWLLVGALFSTLFLFISNGTTAFLGFSVYFCFYELIPTPNMHVRLNIPFRVVNLVLLEGLRGFS